MWLILIPFIFISIGTWAILRYSGWIVSKILSICIGCHIQVGGFCRFGMVDIRLRLRNGLSIHIDSLLLGVFPQQFTKPLIIRLGDVRVEGDSESFRKSGGKKNFSNDASNNQRSGSGSRFLELPAQYIGICVTRVHLVLLETLPGCMIHVTVDDLTLEGFRSREGWQFELLCRLAQGKAFRRKGASGLPLAEFGIVISLSADVDKGCLKRIELQVKDPILSISQGVFGFLYDQPSVVPRSVDDTALMPDQQEEKKISNALRALSDVNVDIHNCTLRYMVPIQDGSRILSLTVSEFSLRKTGQSTDAKLSGLSLSDQAGKTNLKSALLRVELQESCGIVDIRVCSDSVHTSLRIADALWWRTHFVHALPSSGGLKSPTTPPTSTSPLSLSISLDVDALTCDITDTEKFHSMLSTSFFTFTKTSTEMEIGVDSLVFSSPGCDASSVSWDVHHWGHTLYVGVALAQYSSHNGVASILIGVDDCKFEWNDRLAKQLERIVDSLGPAPAKSSKSSKTITVKARAKRAAIIAVARESTFLVYSADGLAFESLSLPNDFAVSARNSRLGVGDVTSAPFHLEVLRTAGKYVARPDDDNGMEWRCWNQSDKDARRAERRKHAEQVAAKRGIVLWGLADTISLSLATAKADTLSLKDVIVSSHGEMYVSWSPLIHRAIYHLFQVSKKSFSCRPSSPHSQPSRSSAVLKLVTQHSVELDLALPRHHRMVWRVPSLQFEKTSDSFLVTSPMLTVMCNGKRILNVTDVSIGKEPVDLAMSELRQAFGGLHLTNNKVWTWSAELFHFHLPFEFNFAEIFTEFLNCFKWIKSVHNIIKKPFTKDSPLPADVRILINEVRLEMEDDPFESSLQANYELLEDEVYECERRRQMLTEKLANIKKSNPLLPQSKIDELFTSLQERNSAIYIERWRKQPPEKRNLFVSTWSEVRIRAFADTSLHGTERCVQLMQEFDPVSHYPVDSLQFTTLWARGSEFDVSKWTMQFRDYPIPYFQATDMHFFGTLVGAEVVEESGRSLRECVIPLPEPWETHTILRNVAPIKYYYDMQCENTSLQTWYGPCWEPCLSMVSLMWNNISAMSLDPSPPLPFWDKMRYLLHGRFSMLCKAMCTTMLASPDPYNSTETVEWCWDDYGLDWLIGEIRIKSGVRVYMRTASKYDDSRILFLPEVRWRIALDWVCGGDPHDHHSAIPCAPHRLPHYATDHDSYRAFRSHCLDMVFSFDVEDGENIRDIPDSKRPHVLLYANTFRCIEFLLNTLTMTNRPVKKGRIFGSNTRTKPQLSKHFRDVKIMVNFPSFYISYWMSHSSDYGFRVTADGLSLSAFMRLSASPGIDATLRRRRAYVWSPQEVTAALGRTQVHVFGDGRSSDSSGVESEETLLMGLEQLQYIREQTGTRDTALHRLIVTDLKASWTDSNRDSCLVIADCVHRAHLLRSILSNDAIKTIKLKTEESEIRRNEGSATRENSAESHEGAGRNRSVSETQNSMLDQLIGEASTKLVAHCEQTTELPTDSLRGVLQCSADDALNTNWQVDLLNSQLVLKGCEKDGFLLVTAARASLTQKIHRCVWRNSQLLGKKSWSAVLSGMQYFAPISCCEGLNKEQFRWLNREVIEEKGHENSADTLTHYISSGEAVGGVVQGNAVSETFSSSRVPLQRIVSRCSCEIYFCYFSESLKTDALEEAALPPMNDNSDSLEEDSSVDCLTLKHNMLEVSSNSAQYEMVVDIVNNLVLFVDPKKKEVAEHRRRLRFECLLTDMQQMRQSIIEQQTELREIVAVVRSLERQIYYVDAQAESDERKRQDLLSEMEEMKAQQLNVSDQLAIFISCYKQRQVEQLRAAAVSARIEKDQMAPVATRFEVCFEDCTWKLTENDGQIGVAQLQIRNFLYTRVMRIDNSGEHCFEVGSIRVINLLPDTIYRDTLHRDERVTHLQPAIRVVLKDMPPVAGICVKEHFEVNISPMVAQITYRFFDKMMVFFFPGQNIHKDENLDTNDDGSQKLSLTRRLANIRNSRQGTQFERKQSTLSTGRIPSSRNGEAVDDIDRMRERADRNNLFVYIKIPEVPFVVSYKGNKDKNLLDVDRLNFVFPLCEYHERSWTWLDVSLAVKQRCRRVLLQQFMKQKLLRNRLTMGGQDEGVSEEDKKRIALGTTSSIDKKKKK